MKENWNKDLNGVYIATHPTWVYLVRFENGVSKELLKNNIKYTSREFNYYGRSSTFVATSNREYEKADKEHTQWLEACIMENKFVGKTEKHIEGEPLLFN